ncbi:MULTISPECIES: thioredoxin fold domain-containing protein [unclassified Campylobacter]|uniref:thioredoxin fold domain-containing protein n=1 Tax=unclassified Campylobacter TaxID=2593542 RepID=UPI0014744C53|nr:MULTISPECIES: thioredoxin fold domain-containing protein [unclassified Campylobacter]QKF91428.1 protein disulfide isomerase, DsbG family [Campylobacter sp. CCUG 57310]
MKKIILASVVAATSLFAASNEQIIDFYKSIAQPGLMFKVTERQKLAENPEYEMVVVNISNGKLSEDEIMFTKGDLLLPDIIDLKNKKAYKAEMKEKITAKNIAAQFNKEEKKNIIMLGNDSKKPTYVMFSDPECPYCRMELEKIETTLKEANVHIILTPVHDKSALQKSFLIYKDAVKAKTDSEKIKILRKYFAEDYKVADNAVSDDEVKMMDDLRTKYLAAGVRSVPYIINLQDLKK